MNHAAIHPTKGLLIYVAPGDDRTARYVAATQSFGEGNDVRLKIPVFEAEHFARATEPGLDLIDNQERAIPAAELLRFHKEITLRVVNAFALHRLDHESGDV